MNQQTTDTARKAIRFFQGQLGPNRITGGPLPGNAGLVVGIKPSPEQPAAAGSSHTSEQNGNGAAGSGAGSSTLDALLVVANRGEEDPPLIEALRDGERIGPAGDVVGEKTRHAILSWREDQIDTDGSMSESYVVSVAATLIQSPPEPGDPSTRDEHQPAAYQTDEHDLASSSVAAEQTKDESSSDPAEARSATDQQSDGEPTTAQGAEPRSCVDHKHSIGQLPEEGNPAQHQHSRAEQPVSQQPSHSSYDDSEPATAETEQQSAHADPDRHDDDILEPVKENEGKDYSPPLASSGQSTPNELNAEPQRVEEPQAPDHLDGEPDDTHVGQGEELPEPDIAYEQPPDAPEAEYEVDTPDLDDPADEEYLYGNAHEDAPGDAEDGTPASEQDTRELEAPVERRPPQEQADASGALQQPGEQVGIEESGGEASEQAAQQTGQGFPADDVSTIQDTYSQGTPAAVDGPDQPRPGDIRQQPTYAGNTDDGPVPSEPADQANATDQHDPVAGSGSSPAQIASESAPVSSDTLYPAGQGPNDPQPESGSESTRAQDGVQHTSTANPPADPPADPPETDDLEDPHSGWLEGLVSGNTPTPEQRAYYIGKQKASKLSAKLTFKKAPEPPPRLATVDPIPEQAIELIASSPKGPGIVMPMTSKGGTGKTTVAVELAFMLGMVAGAYGNNVGGRTGRVLLADMNINNPDLAERIQVDGAGRMGLKDLLNGEHLSRVVNRTALPNVDALFLLGKEDYDKADLPAVFSDERGMEAIISAVAGSGGYDMIVIDTSNTFPGEAYNPASYSLTMWAVAADARYLVLQPEIASFVNAARFAARMGSVLGETEAHTVPVLNRFPVSRVYEEAPITAKMAANRRDAIKAIKRLQEADGYPVTAAMDARGDPLKAPLYLPDYPEEVQGFGAEGRPLCMYSQTFAAAYHRIAMDAVRRIYDNRRPR